MRALIAAATGLAARVRPGPHHHRTRRADRRDVPEAAADHRPRTPVTAARRAEMRRKASLVLLALAVFFAALSPLLRWYAFPRLAKIPPTSTRTWSWRRRTRPSSTTARMKAKKVPKVTIVQTLKGNVEASEKIEQTAGPDVVVWDALSYVAGPDGKMVSKIPERYIFDAHTQEPVHATGEMVDGDPVQARGHRVQVAVPHREAGLRVLRRPGPHLGPHPLQGHPDLPRPGGLLLRADHPLDQGALPEDDAGPGHHPRVRRQDRHHPLVHHRSASSGWNPSPARPSTARRSTRRNCAAAPCSAAATRSPPSPAT